jgi:1,4-dihydroxy-2-naphthoate octaprenyltransferase
MVEKSLFQKAAEYKDASLSFIDDEGFPFSIPVQFQVDTENRFVKILKPQGLPIPVGREISLTFNHITPIPNGGYTDRRYVVFWGRLEDGESEFTLKPSKGFTWDEKEVPFFQYAEMKNPKGRTYLGEIKEKPWLSTPWLIIRTFRLPFVIATILPVVLGAAVAYRSGFFDWTLFGLTMIGALMIHLGVNTANDYFDTRSGADEINTTPTPFSGGSRVIQYGLLPAPAVLSISTASYAVGAAIGLYLAFTRGYPILLIGLLGLLISYGYTAPPLKLVYRGLGELAVGIGFGPLLVLGSYFVQTRTFSLEAFLASLPVGILVMLILYVNEIPDRTWDDEAGKKTLVTQFKEKSVVNGFVVSMVALYLIVVLAVVARIFPITALLVLLTIPLAGRVRNLIKGNLGNPYGLMPAMSKNIRLYVYTALLLLAGYVISFFVAL